MIAQDRSCFTPEDECRREKEGVVCLWADDARELLHKIRLVVDSALEEKNEATRWLILVGLQGLLTDNGVTQDA